MFANASLHGAGFGVGITALDDVFRVQAESQNRASPGNPRMPQTCVVDAVPSVVLRDPHFALAARASYTVEWALYPLAQPGVTDYYAFVNSLRHDLGSPVVT